MALTYLRFQLHRLYPHPCARIVVVPLLVVVICMVRALALFCCVGNALLVRDLTLSKELVVTMEVGIPCLDHKLGTWRRGAAFYH